MRQFTALGGHLTFLLGCFYLEYFFSAINREGFTFCEIPIFILLYVAHEFQVVKKNLPTTASVIFVQREKGGAGKPCMAGLT